MGKVEDEGFPKWLEEKKKGLDARGQQLLGQLIEHNETFGKELFRGDLREGEFHRRLNETHAEKEALSKERKALEAATGQFQRKRTEWTNWYKTESAKAKQLVDENAQLRARKAPVSDGDPLADLDPLNERRPPAMDDELKVTLDQISKRLDEQGQRLEGIDANIPGFLSEHSAAMELSRDEGFKVDPVALTNMALQNNITPRQAYYSMTQEVRAGKAKTDYETAIKDAEERGRKAAFTDRPSPDHIRPSGPSTVERLTGKTDPYPTTRRDIVDSAVEEFRRLRAEDPEMTA